MIIKTKRADKKKELEEKKRMDEIIGWSIFWSKYSSTVIMPW